MRARCAEGSLPVREAADGGQDVLIAARRGGVVDRLGVGVVGREGKAAAHAVNDVDIAGVANAVAARVVQLTCMLEKPR